MRRCANEKTNANYPLRTGDCCADTWLRLCGMLSRSDAADQHLPRPLPAHDLADRNTLEQGARLGAVEPFRHFWMVVRRCRSLWMSHDWSDRVLRRFPKSNW